MDEIKKQLRDILNNNGIGSGSWSERIMISMVDAYMLGESNKKNRSPITEGEIADACNEAYIKLGNNAYFANGFAAGVRFAIEKLHNN